MRAYVAATDVDWFAFLADRPGIDDGDSYLRLHGEVVSVPGEERLRPDPAALAWHNENRFRG